MESTHNNDFLKQMFRDMLEIEESMDALYAEILQGAIHKDIAQIIRKIRSDEVQHEKNVNEILKILDEVSQKQK
jgi:rubrerythrin